MYIIRLSLSMYIVVVGYLFPVAETWKSNLSDDKIWALWLGLIVFEGILTPLGAKYCKQYDEIAAAFVRCIILSIIVFDFLDIRNRILQISKKCKESLTRLLKSTPPLTLETCISESDQSSHDTEDYFRDEREPSDIIIN